ncbi:hypothetical protein ACFQ4J_06445 [Laceyella tengchongensis]|jgi:hypothetical protein
MKLNKTSVFVAVGVLLLVIGGVFFYSQSDSENSFEGEWKLNKEDDCATKKMVFYDDNLLTITDGLGASYTGMLTEIGEGKYSFDVKIRTVVYGIKKLTDSMLLLKDVDGRECRLMKVN